MSALLDVQGVSVAFGGITALSDVSFQVQPGEVVGLIGPNGAGKTTLLNVLMGYIPFDGEVTFEGRPLRRELPHARVAIGIGRSFQHVDILEQLTAEEVLLLGLHYQAKESFIGSVLRTPAFRRAEHANRQAVRQQAADLGLPDDVLGRRMGELPYGMRKMVDVARAVVCRPRLVLLDEPSSGVSLDERSEIAQLLRLIRSQGTGVVLIDHNMSMIGELSDRVVALHFGRKILEGTFEDVTADPIVRSEYLGMSRESSNVGEESA